MTMKRLLKYVLKYKFLFILSLLLGIINVCLTIYIPYKIGLGIDFIVSSGNVNFDELIKCIIIVVICAVGAGLSIYLMNIINNKIVYAVSMDIRNEAFNKIIDLPISYIDSNPYGETISKVITDVEGLQDGLLMAFNQFFTGIMTIILTLVIMFVLNWFIALLVVVITPLSLFTSKIIASKSFKLFKKQSELRAVQTGFTDEIFTSLKTVQAYNMEESNEKKYKKINDDLKKCSFKSTFVSSLVNPTTRCINSLVYATVCIAGALICVKSFMGLTITVGVLTTFLSYANSYTKPFNEISSVISEVQNSLACASRVFELIDENKETNCNEKSLVDVKGNIEIKDLNFSYDKNKELIKDFNLMAYQGQNIAIVGPTGCGKTTLINLLMRFYDIDSGIINIDGIDTSKIDRKELRSNFGMVLQDTWIKNASVYDNIKIGKKDATKEEVISACKNAYCDSFITRLPNGYDTIISDDANLSQGQKQLICIARIMLCLPPMVILDEATSSIDTRTEIKIQNAFNMLTENRTAFIVAHRLKTIKNADIILVMNNGNIVEQGTHKELLMKDGFYKHLYDSQFPIIK